MRIFAVCQFYHPENFTITPLMRQLVALGHEVTIVTGRPNAGFGHILNEYKKVKFEIIDGVKVHRLPIIARRQNKISLIINYFSYYFLARSFVKKHRGEYDVVFTMSLSPVISMVPAIDFARKHKLPLLMYCVDIWPESVVFTNNIANNSLGYRYLKNWSKRIYQAADRILVGSPTYQTYMHEEHGIQYRKMATLVQPSLASGLQGAPRQFEAKHNLVYIGNFGQVQLLDELLEVLLDYKNSDLHVHLIGYGTALPRLLSFIDTNGLSQIVKYYGTLSSDVAATFIPNADALLVPLKAGGYVGATVPNKLILYLGYGRPIIGALVGDGRNILQEAGGGLLVTPSKDGLKQGIEWMLRLSEQEKIALGARNIAYFNENHTLEITAKRLESYLSELIN
ncbi:MAG TPA: glycosyltransferase family 4 protein [Bacilli bacterium]|nr:glycosyltransferase family 4 protein [Bacilli bacterium]